MDFELYIAGLNGYLKALRRLSGNEFSFFAKIIPCECIEDAQYEAFSSMKPLGAQTLKGKEEIGFKEIRNSLKTFIFNGILSESRIDSKKVSDYLSSVLIDDINEYYGLAANSLDKDTLFHPLISGPVFALDMEHQDPKSSSFCFLVRIGDQHVFTCFFRGNSEQHGHPLQQWLS